MQNQRDRMMFFFIMVFFLQIHNAQAQLSAQMIQFPDVSQTHICFNYGDDLWIVDKKGGLAHKLSSPDGRESFPKFSPDGQTIAFNANYDGSNDVYTIPVDGGVPNRVTGHGMNETLMDWYPDGKNLLYSSSSESGKQRFAQFYKINKKGGLPSKLPIELGAFAALSPDGKLLAFTDKSRAFRSWKRYRGGTAPDIHIMDLASLECENITNNTANDELPMWHGSKVYYMSDNGPAKRNNIWIYDTQTKRHEQLTKFTDFDIHFPSIGPSDLVFEAGGQLHLMELANHQVRQVEVQVINDFTSIKPVTKSVGRYIQNFSIAPDGSRAVVEARGEIFSLPKENGFVQNLSRTSGNAERYPAWSPDGKHIAYFSDKTGEYELCLRNLENYEEKVISNLGKGFRYNIYWSPDSKKLVFIDQTMTFYMLDVNTKAIQKIDQDAFLFEGGLRGFRVSWSSDSRWIAYNKSSSNRQSAIFIYDTKNKRIHQVTAGFYNDGQVVFDPEGKYLYLTTNRTFDPIYSDFDNTWVYPNATQIAAISLRADVPSPLAPENDAVEIKDDKEEKDKKDDGKKSKKKKKKGDKDKDDNDEDEDKKDEVEAVEIDFDDIERRLVVLPIKAGNFGRIDAIKGNVIYVKSPNSGSDKDAKPNLQMWDLEEKEAATIAEGIWNYEVSANGKAIIVAKKRNLYIIEAKPKQKLEDALAIGDMQAKINPREEWKQIFNDVWRFERDFFYDADMHGVDWNAMKDRYAPLIEQAASRSDVNYVLGELIGELNASHTYRGGGDNKYAARKNTGYLGIDWEQSNGHYRIKKIIQAAPWDNEVRSPLDLPGLNVKEGTYILAVNGIPLNEYQDPWIAFAGLANKTVELTINKTPDFKKARKILVKPLRSETRLRNLAWIEANRQKVDELSGGRIGYIYVPSTGIGGQDELIRMFYGQSTKEGLIIDERFNNGGQIPDRFVELLDRKPLAYFKVRDGKDWQWPPVAHFGPKAMLINGWSGSGGDAFPDYFRKRGLGKLIGSRTWGGLIGISGAPSLIDGGGITVPTFRMYDPNGEWFLEGHGVDPDIEVKEDHSALAKGQDTQLEKAVEQVLKEMKEQGTIQPPRPQKEDRSN